MVSSDVVVALQFEPLVMVPRDEHQTLWTFVCWTVTAGRLPDDSSRLPG
jgi:hypothetical protein